MSDVTDPFSEAKKTQERLLDTSKKELMNSIFNLKCGLCRVLKGLGFPGKLDEQ